MRFLKISGREWERGRRLGALESPGCKAHLSKAPGPPTLLSHFLFEFRRILTKFQINSDLWMITNDLAVHVEGTYGRSHQILIAWIIACLEPLHNVQNVERLAKIGAPWASSNYRKESRIQEAMTKPAWLVWAGTSTCSIKQQHYN